MVTFDPSVLQHYGTPRKSGRYPWGSGGDNTAPGAKRNMSFMDTVKDLRRQGLSDKEIYDGMGMSSGSFRARITIETNAERQEKIYTVQKLAEKGVSRKEIQARTGIPEPTIRSYLAAGASEKAEAFLATSKMLKEEVDQKKWIDVGSGVENHLGISKEKLKAAVDILKEQGYKVHTVNVPQVGTGHETKVKVVGPPESTQREAWLDRDNIQQLNRVSVDNGKTYAKVHAPIPVNPNRLAVRWAEDGGTNSDGVIYVRPGAEGLSMGGNNYAQVRIQVGKDKYLKGMAVLNDDLPAGVDLMFNTNKSRMPDKLDALKPIKADAQLPFGAVIRRQVVDNPGTPNEKNVSAINLVNEAGAWSNWSKTIASQALSKQSPRVAREQLDKTFEKQKKEYDEISALTNPVVKKKLLENFAKTTDSASVHLKAVVLKGSAWHVILPVENLKANEIFAPRYEDGERVALIRYPHGGPFEIPELVVNNKNRSARKSVGLDSVDAVGIHPSVAERLSGADFDGDTVLVIPNKSGKIKSQPALEGLKGFEPKARYKLPEDKPGIRDMKDPGGMTQRIMGEASNLITDMTLRAASPDKLARAVAYSMVTIDAEKHHLDYNQAKKDFGIKALKDEFQVDPKNPSSRGASTLISRASSDIRIADRKPRPMKEGGPVDKKTGELVYVPTGKVRTARDGSKVEKTITVEKLSITKNAHDLSSGTPMEKIYADHSNRLKSLANQARLDVIKTPDPRMSPSAKKVYNKEVESLASKLHRAQLNAPRERQAQIVANAAVKVKKQSNPHLDKDDIQKISFDELTRARKRFGAGKDLIDIEPKEWEAIQAGAISASRLKEILSNSDVDKVKQLATPRPKALMSTSKTSRAKALLETGRYTRAQVAAQLGVSLSTLDRAFDD